jgi:hypothetical protein
MSGTFFIEAIRRLVALALMTAGAATLINGAQLWLWLGLMVLGLAVYLAIPRPPLPKEALRYEGMPAIYMPDVLGFLLGVVFFGLPFVIMKDIGSGGAWLLFFMFFLPGVAALAIFYIAARNATSWVVLRPDALTVCRAGRVRELAFADIRAIRWRERRLPRWVSVLLILFGGARGAGTALLHGDRPSHALVLACRDGDVEIAADAFPGLKKIVAALKKAGITISA